WRGGPRCEKHHADRFFAKGVSDAAGVVRNRPPPPERLALRPTDEPPVDRRQDPAARQCEGRQEHQQSPPTLRHGSPPSGFGGQPEQPPTHTILLSAAPRKSVPALAGSRRSQDNRQRGGRSGRPGGVSRRAILGWTKPGGSRRR